MGIPSLELWELITGKRQQLKVYLDNQAMQQILRTGKVHVSLRHVNKTHGVQLSWLTEMLKQQMWIIVDCNTSRMCADIFTKSFTSHTAWRHACLLIGIVPKQMWETFNFFKGPEAAGCAVRACAVARASSAPPASCCMGDCVAKAVEPIALMASPNEPTSLSKEVEKAEQFHLHRPNEELRTISPHMYEKIKKGQWAEVALKDKTMFLMSLTAHLLKIDERMLLGLVYGLTFFLLIFCFPGAVRADFFFAVCSGVGVC